MMKWLSLGDDLPDLPDSACAPGTGGAVGDANVVRKKEVTRYCAIIRLQP